MQTSTQMELEQRAQQIECNILVPSSDDSDDQALENESLDCFKCRGSQVNNKGLPCRKCNGSGKFNLKGYGSVVKAVKEEIQTFCTEQFTQLFKEYTANKRVHQRDQVHSGFKCVGCE